MTYYLGLPGNLTALPDPDVGLTFTPERIGGTHQLLSGAKVRDTLGRSGSWTLSFTAIDLTAYGILQGFYLGTYGSGPYYFLDPECRNLLTPNVSSGTDYTQDATGFATIAAGATLASSTAAAAIGQRSLAVQWASGLAPSASGVQTQNPYAVVASSTVYTGSVAVGFRSGMVGFAAECRLIWFGSNLAYISENAGSAVVIPTGSFSVLSCTATSPANAAYCSVRLANNSTTTSITTAYADDWQLEAGSSTNAWVPGNGVPLVTVEPPTRSTPLSGISDAQLTLVQVS